MIRGDPKFLNFLGKEYGCSKPVNCNCDCLVGTNYDTAQVE
jgi:hypothetical protein